MFKGDSVKVSVYWQNIILSETDWGGVHLLTAYHTELYHINPEWMILYMDKENNTGDAIPIFKCCQLWLYLPNLIGDFLISASFCLAYLAPDLIMLSVKICQNFRKKYEILSSFNIDSQPSFHICFTLKRHKHLKC